MQANRIGMLVVVLILAGAACLIAPAHADSPCVEVEIGGDKAPALECLNRQLQQQPDGVWPPENVPPLGTTAPTVNLGGHNHQALNQQYGPSLGTSVLPYRPSQNYFPLGDGGH